MESDKEGHPVGVPFIKPQFNCNLSVRLISDALRKQMNKEGEDNAPSSGKCLPTNN